MARRADAVSSRGGEGGSARRLAVGTSRGRGWPFDCLASGDRRRAVTASSSIDRLIKEGGRGEPPSKAITDLRRRAEGASISAITGRGGGRKEPSIPSTRRARS